MRCRYACLKRHRCKDGRKRKAALLLDRSTGEAFNTTEEREMQWFASNAMHLSLCSCLVHNFRVVSAGRRFVHTEPVHTQLTE